MVLLQGRITRNDSVSDVEATCEEHQKLGEDHDRATSTHIDGQITSLEYWKRIKKFLNTMYQLLMYSSFNKFLKQFHAKRL